MKRTTQERQTPHILAALGPVLAVGAATLSILAGAGCASRPAREIDTAAAAQAPPASLALPATAGGLAELFAADGLSAVRLDAGSVVLRQDDLQVLVFLEDEGASLQAVLPYLGRHAADRRALDRWNATRRFGRAYLDHEGGPILASDLLLAADTPAELVQSWGRLFLAMAAAFRAEVWPDFAPPPQPADE